MRREAEGSRMTGIAAAVWVAMVVGLVVYLI